MPVTSASLSTAADHMRGLGLGALSHAIWHANYFSHDNAYWNELSVLQAAHAAEILIKARISQEHPLLVFEVLPKQKTGSGTALEFDNLAEFGRTYQFFDLPDRLWATTGIQLPRVDLFRSFGKLRNAVQHFAPPNGRDFGQETLEFIFGVIDPLINSCWGLCAVDFNEDHEPYVYLVSGLVGRGIEFIVSSGVIENLEYTDLDWPKGKPSYRTKMEAAGLIK